MATHEHKSFYATQGILLCKNYVIKWFVGLIDLEQDTARDKKSFEHWKT